MDALELANLVLFLSTLSLRRATVQGANDQQEQQISIHALLAESDSIIDIINDVIDDFYPRSPCGERQRVTMDSYLEFVISIHALLAESDNGHETSLDRVSISIHALLAESDGVHYDNYNLHCVISIHALLAESDQS